jgi:hypothetical protein
MRAVLDGWRIFFRIPGMRFEALAKQGFLCSYPVRTRPRTRRYLALSMPRLSSHFLFVIRRGFSLFGIPIASVLKARRIPCGTRFGANRSVCRLRVGKFISDARRFAAYRPEVQHCGRSMVCTDKRKSVTASLCRRCEDRWENSPVDLGNLIGVPLRRNERTQCRNQEVLFSVQRRGHPASRRFVC